MAAGINGIFNEDLRKNILDSKLLVVGAGGIGCEILKNLVLVGFPNIEIIDLDTIEITNLNRQFLFHKEHVGKSKAYVARESALSFNPKVNIKAYHDSITKTNFGVSFFKQFTIVLNALDNRQARNHVNRMCLTADVPLIESGTSGYDGQVELIKKGLTQCYECTPKAAQKVFPGCTIRNTPSEPIHCIVWAKHLFNQLFGETNEDENVSPDTADPEAGADAGKEALSNESNEKGNIERVNTRLWAQQSNYDPEKIFNKLFFDDIKYLLSMSNLWTNRNPPKPIKWNQFDGFDNNNVANNDGLPDQKIWTLSECVEVFAKSITSLREQFQKLQEGDHLVWDKDDKSAMSFVASCANIRAIIFNINKTSLFDIKSMAGNIIPAIATTNAITAGLVVMMAFRILQNEFKRCQTVYTRLRPDGKNQILAPDKYLTTPNPKCYVCSPKPEVVLKIDTKKVTIKDLRDIVLIKTLNMIDPDVIIEGKGIILISSEEGETDCNNDKILSEFHIVDGTILKVDDFFQKYELSITIIHMEAERDELPFEVVTDMNNLKLQEEDISQKEEDKNLRNGDNIKKPRIEQNDSDDDMCVIEDLTKTNGVKSDTPTRKRKIDGGEGPSMVKKSKTVYNNDESDDDLIIMDD